MELTGSEYWTYFLKKRIGSKEAAVALTDSTKPITAGQALQLGMVDNLMLYSPSSSFVEEVGKRPQEDAVHPVVTALHRCWKHREFELQTDVF